MRNALAILQTLRAGPPGDAAQRLVFVCGPMAELGGQTDALHVELGDLVAGAGVDVLLTVGEPTRATARRARQTARHDLQTRHFDDTLSLCDELPRLVRKDDIVLVKGSRTARLERVVEKLREAVAAA
jgi:UDP-N-acetylmuramoyl-tripeptide--D-alanyl-D-alanine ligase